MKGFLVAGGSVPGTDHINPGQPGWTNNHDAFAWHADEDLLVAVVCDGCGSTAHPEVGAKLGSRMLLKSLVDHIREGLWKPDEDLERSLNILWVEMIIYLRDIAGMLADEEFEAVVAGDHFLFTLVFAVMTEEMTHIVSCGDGVYALNGEVTVIPPAVGNAPPYLGHEMVPGSMPEQYLKFTIQKTLPTKDVQSILIGTDGTNDLVAAADKLLPGKQKCVGPLSQLWTDDKYVTNPDYIRRHLSLANLETIDESKEHPRIQKGLLHDDTTMVVIRHIQGE